MFDIGFLELSVIAVVALLVIGPERLPSVARAAGQWIGGIRRFVNSVQADINSEVSKVDELKHLLEEQNKIQSMHEILEQTPPNADDPKPAPSAKPEYLVKAMPDTDTPDTATNETQPANIDTAKAKDDS